MGECCLSPFCWGTEGWTLHSSSFVESHPRGEGSTQDLQVLVIKGKTKVRGSAKSHKVLLVNYTLVMEIGVLVPDIPM